MLKNPNGRMFNDLIGRSYATEDRAAKEAVKVRDHSGLSFHWIIAARPDGRFMPILIFSEQETQYGIHLAQKGYCVLGPLG